MLEKHNHRTNIWTRYTQKN